MWWAIQDLTLSADGRSRQFNETFQTPARSGITGGRDKNESPASVCFYQND
jgi:hypothetical protein